MGMAIMTLRHRFADTVKVGSPGPDLTKMALAINLCRLRCELRRPYPTSYYRNWFLLGKAVELKIQPQSRTFCFPGTCDQANTNEEKERAFTPARHDRASTSHEHCSGWTVAVHLLDTPGFKHRWTDESCWVQLKVA